VGGGVGGVEGGGRGQGWGGGVWNVDAELRKQDHSSTLRKNAYNDNCR
jgi:hypothetical protein